jgi:hypothetical protein
MTQEFSNSAFDNAWPFWALELPVTASTIDVEKAARDISAKLQLKVPGIEEFLTPSGKRRRDEFVVREAKSMLLNPELRLLAEFWYIPSDSSESGVAESDIKKTVKEWQQILGVQFWVD